MINTTYDFNASFVQTTNYTPVYFSVPVARFGGSSEPSYEEAGQAAAPEVAEVIEAPVAEVAAVVPTVVEQELVTEPSTPSAVPSEAFEQLWSSPSLMLRVVRPAGQAEDAFAVTTSFAPTLRVHPIMSRLCVTVLPDPPLRSDGLDAAHACLTPSGTRSYARAAVEAETQATAGGADGRELVAFKLSGLAPGVAYRVQAAVMDMRGTMHRAGGALQLDSQAQGQAEQPLALPMSEQPKQEDAGDKSKDDASSQAKKGKKSKSGRKRRSDKQDKAVEEAKPQVVRGQAGIPSLVPVWEAA